MPLPVPPSSPLPPQTPAAETAPLRPEIITRRLSYIMLVRVVLYTMLVGTTVMLHVVWGTAEELGGPYVSVLFVFIAVIYVLNIVYAWAMRWLPPDKLAVIQVVVDLLTTASLVHFTGGADSPFLLFFLLTPIAAAMTLSRRGARLAAVGGTILLVTVIALGFMRHLPVLPGQTRLPWTLGFNAMVRSALINGGAMAALAALAGHLADQLRAAAQRLSLQQDHIADLTHLNADIIRCLTSGLITSDNSGRVVMLNTAAAELLDCRPSSAVGRSFAELLPELVQVHGAAAEAASPQRTELPLTRQGATHIIAVTISPLLDRGGGTIGRITVLEDRTRLRRMEQTIKRSEHLAAIGRLAAGVAHEIRNPLASISGSLELLQAEAHLSQDAGKLMRIALREIERLEAMIVDLLDFASPRPPRCEPLDLGQVIDAIVESIGGLLGEAAPRVEVIERHEDLWVSADRDQLSGVLWNLVRNAWQSGEHDRVAVSVRSAPPNRVSIGVEDHGSGIAAAELNQIFEPFFTTKTKGTGLGLAVVQRIVNEHGGTIEVQSKPGQGTAFTISLPRIAAPQRT